MIDNKKLHETEEENQYEKWFHKKLLGFKFISSFVKIYRNNRDLTGGFHKFMKEYEKKAQQNVFLFEIPIEQI